MKTRIATFAGWSNTGKTTFIESCLLELARRGIQAGALKSVRHPGSFQLPGKDTSRFFSAGAIAAIASDEEIVTTARPPARWDAAALEAIFPGVHAILVEGRSMEGAYAVIVGGTARSEDALKKPLEGFDAIVTEHAELAALARARGLDVYAPADAPAFVGKVFGPDPEREDDMEERSFTIMNNGEEVPLNPFVKETFENVILARVKGLTKTDPGGEIVITLGAKK